MSEQSAGENQRQALARIRRALGRTETLSPTPLEPFLEEPLQGGREEVVARFAGEVASLAGHLHQVRTSAEVIDCITRICHDAGVREVALSGAPLLTELNVQTELAHRDLSTMMATGFEPNDHERLTAKLAECGAGVTAVDYAIAETGTLVVSSDEESGLLVSLLPPIHIAVLRSQQIIPGLAAVITKLQEERVGRPEPSRSVTFITGPSRTSDVELTLSIGVHGPKELHLILIDD